MRLRLLAALSAGACASAGSDPCDGAADGPACGAAVSVACDEATEIAVLADDTTVGCVAVSAVQAVAGTNLEADVAAIRQELSQATASLDALRVDVDAANAAIDVVETDLTANQTGLTQTVSTVSDLNTRLTTAESTLDGLNTHLADLETDALLASDFDVWAHDDKGTFEFINQSDPQGSAIYGNLPVTGCRFVLLEIGMTIQQPSTSPSEVVADMNVARTIRIWNTETVGETGAAPVAYATVSGAFFGNAASTDAGTTVRMWIPLAGRDRIGIDRSNTTKRALGFPDVIVVSQLGCIR